MRKHINLNEYTDFITDKLKNGILLNTFDEKFNTMVIAWGNIGFTWNLPTFTVYVRENRFSKKALDKTGEFTISIPLENLDATTMQICGLGSGRNMDKQKEAKLTLFDGEKTRTNAIKEFPLTLECKILYSQKQDLSRIQKDLQVKFYPQEVDGTFPRANKDAHTMYIAEIVNAYILE